MRRLMVLAMSISACTSASGRTVSSSEVRLTDSLELIVAATTDVHGWLRGWD
jgi:hypothetical protein